MAVLKRFSYDNIVEHNPTAPDPVEGGGSGGVAVNYYTPVHGWLQKLDAATGEPMGEDVQFASLLPVGGSINIVMVQSQSGLTMYILLNYVITSDSIYCLSVSNSGTLIGTIISDNKGLAKWSAGVDPGAGDL